MGKLVTSLLVIFFAVSSSLMAQKKPLDHTVYDNWKSLSEVTMSQDGKFSLFVVSAQAADGYLMQRNLLNGTFLSIARGKAPFITFDSKYGVCAIAPFFEETRQARIQKKKAEELPKDTLCVWTLGKSDFKMFAHITSFKSAKEGSIALAFTSEPPADTANKQSTPRKERGEGSDLILYYFATGSLDTLKHVAEYSFDKEGTQLFIIRKFNSRDNADIQDGLYLYNLYTKTEQPLLTGPRKARFFLPVSDKDGQFFAFYANTDTTKAAEKLINIYFFKKGDDRARLMVDENIKGLHRDWIISQNRILAINREGTRLFFGIAPKPLEKDTSLIDFETARLDIWHYLDDHIQTRQLNLLPQEQRANFLSYIRIDQPQNGLIQLAASDYPNVGIPNDYNSDWAYGYGHKPYRIERQWNVDAPADLYLINVADGEAKKVLTAATISDISVSPQGKYLCWYEKSSRQWISYEVASGNMRNLTSGLGVAFWDETHDSPSMPDSYNSAGWREGDAAFLVYDRYDIWELDPAGVKAPVMLTDGLGRKQQYTFRFLHWDYDRGAPEVRMHRSEPVISGKGMLYFTTFDNVNKLGGFYLKDQSRRQAQMQKLVMDAYSFSHLQRSKDGKIVTFSRANFSESPNLWMTRDQFKTQTRLSDINPQQKEYNWGTAELVRWTSANGIPCDGILYKPEDFDPNKKYPMIVYFYEILSNGLYSYRMPAPSASSVNFSYFVSNGYLVFTPDIHFTIGHPGQSTMDCVMPGVDMLCKHPWVDEKNMAIQGHSWGGYEVAYMITQTNRFKAAGAGAPVINLTSAYGGIRLDSGRVRQHQSEGDQERLGKNLWDGLDLYIKNSPLFYAPNVTTPLLIMHNDRDGAVPWYQGIEYFTALRRLGKPVWMLQYNDESHVLSQRKNRIDLSIRLSQFFDHFLKGAPAPVWIKEGVPATRKGIDWGLGYE